ncbi:hypothetical protein SARC_09940 [Sphaeroforma arctica JP610]|uniref:Uncharacterized protein n=1 Tax=Sphaeroforma arctica JP610 TaxID=667725 RepID=A0A0L0FLF0_9EUKA|nr:hypothetical protein SARC_09940 [Sphaeroforma arctica JP610]KNC77599.1 hypothetical protein SARC_09940 [Sphaeroforma arctica JP610]|eukprot:XP_014151501.1 hypothetical protein SARC_09940 [Sphaeroforma arctica JP610]
MKETRTVVVPVIGIPGSGKSTLCRMLQKCAQEQEDTYTIDMLCYDDLFDGYATKDREARKDDTYIADTGAMTSETGKRVVEDMFAIQTGISLPPKRKDQGKHSTDEHTHESLVEGTYATEAGANKHANRRNTAGMRAKEAASAEGGTAAEGYAD